MSKNGEKQNSSTGLQTHSTDFILEILLAALPIAAQKLSREQSIDYGTILESVKSLLKEREKVSFAFSPFKQNNETSQKANSDLVLKMWEAF